MSEPIDDLLARIRRGLTFAPGTWDRGDMRLLLEKSAAEIERLWAERDVIMREWAIETDESLDETITRNVDGWKQRALKAEADAAALREALEDIARGDYSDPMCKLTPEARARAALEGKR